MPSEDATAPSKKPCDMPKQATLRKLFDAARKLAAVKQRKTLWENTSKALGKPPQA